MLSSDTSTLINWRLNWSFCGPVGFYNVTQTDSETLFCTIRDVLILCDLPSVTLGVSVIMEQQTAWSQQRSAGSLIERESSLSICVLRLTYSELGGAGCHQGTC